MNQLNSTGAAHPHIVKYYDSFQETGRWYLEFEYVEGFAGNCYRRLEKYPAADKLRWSHELAQALDFVHKLGLLHHDVKPENVMIRESSTTQETQAVLIDFGLSGPERQVGSSYKGSALYSDLQKLGGQRVTTKSDVYAWGITMWEMVEQAEPFPDVESLTELWAALKAGERPPFTEELWEGELRELRDIIEKCWDSEPENRPSMSTISSRLAAATSRLECESTKTL
jgi:serine/threonine protein kinase